MRSPCSCGREHYARGLCHTCWKRAWRQGRLDEHPGVGHVPEPPLLADQLAARGWDVIGDCWVLHGVPNGEGYLYVCNGRRRLTAARAAYEAWREPVLANQVIDTTCRNGACIAPSHLVLRRITRHVCSVRGCSKPHFARTLCRMHHARLKRRGLLDTLPHIRVPPTATPEERLHHIGWNIVGDCWMWRGGLSEDGYGRLGGWKQGKHYRQKQAHRVAYECWVGPIPEGHRVIQKCGNPACINPDHLFTKSKQMFFQDMQAESMASRHIHEEAKPRRYRLSPSQVREVDAMLRTARLGLMEGRLSKGEYEHRMFEIERYVGYIRDGCCARESPKPLAPRSPHRDGGRTTDSGGFSRSLAHCRPGRSTAG
jgi:hypothetical protein